MLLIVAFTLFRPGYWLDKVEPAYETRQGSEIVALADAAEAGSELRLTVSGPDFNDPDKTIRSIVIAPISKAGAGGSELSALGLVVSEDSGTMLLEEPLFGTPNQALGQQFDFYGDAPVTVSQVQIENDRMPKEVFYLPAILLLGFVILLQRRRQEKPAF